MFQGNPAIHVHTAWLHILRRRKVPLRKQWRNYGSTSEFQRILVREDFLCLCQTIASAANHVGGIIAFREQEALQRAGTPGQHETKERP
jgi:hypothetical protein